MLDEGIDRDVGFRGLSAEQRELLMIQAAKRYYGLNLTIGDLAKEMGLTRWQARRLLDEARASGIVRIEIVPRASRCPDLESRLQRCFGLKEAVVAPPSGDDDDEALMLDGVAQAAAKFIAALGAAPLIGVSWGRTMSAVARRLPSFWNEGVEVVLLNGAMNICSLDSHQQHGGVVRPLRQWHGNLTAGARRSRSCRDTRCAGTGPDHRERAGARTARARNLLRHGLDGARFRASTVGLRHRRGTVRAQDEGRRQQYSEPLYRRRWRYRRREF